MRTIMSSIVLERHHQGAAILLPALKRLRISVAQAPIVSLASVVRNVTSYYKRLGKGKYGRVSAHSTLTFLGTHHRTANCTFVPRRTPGYYQRTWHN